MALHRGIQSAIFYYLSCAPCAEARYRKKRKEEAKRDRLDREALEADLPNLYRHPSPSSTNPYWQTEIALGPTLESRGRRKPAQAESQRGAKRPGTVSSHASDLTSSDDVSQRPDSDDRHDSKWNFRFNQRQDEEPRGSSTNLNGSTCGDSIRRPPTARTKDSTRSNFQSFRNPPINDLHPAIVTKVHSREEVMWMMQPPPVAEVMNGKAFASRSRSGSAASRPASNHPSLIRQPSDRYVPPQSLQVNDSTLPAISRDNSTRTSGGTRDAEQHIGHSNISTRDFVHTDARSEFKEQQRPSPLLLPQTSTRVLLSADLGLQPPSRKIASRSQLAPITSDRLAPNTEDADVEFYTPAQTPNEHPISPPLYSADNGLDLDSSTKRQSAGFTQHSAILVHENSLKLVQDLHPGSGPGVGGVLQTKVVTATNPVEPVDDRSGVTHPELFETWKTPDFELPRWVHEHTKREVQQRWSMDL